MSRGDGLSLSPSVTGAMGCFLALLFLGEPSFFARREEGDRLDAGRLDGGLEDVLVGMDPKGLDGKLWVSLRMRCGPRESDRGAPVQIPFLAPTHNTNLW